MSWFGMWDGFDDECQNAPDLFAPKPQTNCGQWVNEYGQPVGWDTENPNCPASSCWCSKCGDWLTASDEYPATGLFCPNCGIRMK